MKAEPGRRLVLAGLVLACARCLSAAEASAGLRWMAMRQLCSAT